MLEEFRRAFALAWRCHFAPRGFPGDSLSLSGSPDPVRDPPILAGRTEHLPGLRKRSRRRKEQNKSSINVVINNTI